MPRPYNTGLIHGTLSGYNWYACRCEECRDAYRRYYGHVPLEEYLASVKVSHGTEGKYASGCRCDACRKAASAARAERRKRKAAV